MTEIRGKELPKVLKTMIGELGDYSVSFARGFTERWKKIVVQGNALGYTEEQLRDIARPILKEKMGLNSKQVWYIFHREEHIQRQLGTKFRTDLEREGNFRLDDLHLYDKQNLCRIIRFLEVKIAELP